MRKTFATTILLLWCSIGISQILDIKQPLFTDAPFFNINFIKQNKVKSITGSISSKKVRDIIRSKGLDFYYEFNEHGRLITQLATHFSQGKKDSTATTYTYNDNGRLITKRKNDSYGFFSHNYSYDPENNIVSQTYCRDENLFNSKSCFKLKKQYIISKDSFSYAKFDPTQTKKYYYNGYKKVFKEQLNTFDQYGYLTEEYTKFIIGNNKKKTSYEYDEYGRLYKKHSYTNIAQDRKTTEVFSYDQIGNVLDIKTYNNDKHVSTKQFLYDKKTMLLTAQIIQDIESSFLRIIQYRYTFFGDDTEVHFTDTLESSENN
jgi:hypothetical protein